MIKAVALDHVTVTTPEELQDEVIAWYVDVLGLERIPKAEGARTSGAWLELAGAQVHITEDPHNPPDSAHFCLEVEDLGESVASLRASGCHIEQAKPIVGRSRCFVRDPAGNRIELVQYEGPA